MHSDRQISLSSVGILLGTEIQDQIAFLALCVSFLHFMRCHSVVANQVTLSEVLLNLNFGDMFLFYNIEFFVNYNFCNLVFLNENSFLKLNSFNVIIVPSINIYVFVLKPTHNRTSSASPSVVTTLRCVSVCHEKARLV